MRVTQTHTFAHTNRHSLGGEQSPLQNASSDRPVRPGAVQQWPASCSVWQPGPGAPPGNKNTDQGEHHGNKHHSNHQNKQAGKQTSQQSQRSTDTQHGVQEERKKNKKIRAKPLRLTRTPPDPRPPKTHTQI